MQYICNDKTVRSDAIQAIKDFDAQSPSTQVKKNNN